MKKGFNIRHPVYYKLAEKPQVQVEGNFTDEQNNWSEYSMCTKYALTNYKFKIKLLRESEKLVIMMQSGAYMGVELLGHYAKLLSLDQFFDIRIT